ncbi:MAG: acetyl-coenzyme A carboxylase carboxyl transferase subunit alpha [Nitrospirales bacterium]|nr:MAG: acetyl-coenzyme A carboxylase carboxyl transferase subunit alpha [Nitrospirales bacterium]
MREYLDFEKPLKELEERIAKLVKSKSKKVSVQEAIVKSTEQLANLEREIYANLSPWQHSQIARHPQRPSISDYLEHMTNGFMELHGDRLFGDDRAIIGGFTTWKGRSIMVIGHEKGKTLKERMRRNFGMAKPEGYRKALRLMKLAERFNRPIITFIDTPGAYPGVDAEQRGQAEAIARNLLEMSRLQVPILAVVTGEGGSGGALALGVADRVLMLEHAIYSVISPEGCAAILWGDATKSSDAATALRMTGPELQKLNIIEEVIPEPMGGAHRDPKLMADRVSQALDTHFLQLQKMSPAALRKQRAAKFRSLGAFGSSQATPKQVKTVNS